MIRNIQIKNFKSLKSVDVDLSNLNLLTGLNGSGKSSLLQALLLLRQSEHEIGRGRMLLQKKENELFDAGVAKDVYFQWGIEKTIDFRLLLENRFLLDWSFDCDVLISPDDNILTTEKKYTAADLIQSAVFTQQFHYLNAERLSPQNLYSRNVEVVENERSIGVFGEYAVHFLEHFGNNYEVGMETYEVSKKDEKTGKETTETKKRVRVGFEHLLHPKAKSEKLIHQADAWLSEISPGVNLIPEKVSNEESRISYQFGTSLGRTNRFKPKNVGFGLSYVLPVIVTLLTAEPGQLILMENPESHIHPRGQAELGRLLAAAAQSGAQLLVETHSDHILNGIRIAARNKQIDPGKAVAFYFKRNEEDNSSDITPIIVDANGKLHRKTAEGTTAKIPKGFFDEWTNSMAQLF